MRVERFVPTVRTAQRSEPFICAKGEPILDVKDTDRLKRPTSLVVGDVVIVAEVRDASERSGRLE